MAHTAMRCLWLAAPHTCKSEPDWLGFNGVEGVLRLYSLKLCCIALLEAIKHGHEQQLNHIKHLQPAAAAGTQEAHCEY